jgi:hypothetical protein
MKNFNLYTLLCSSSTFLSVVAAPSSRVKCPVIFEGRIPSGTSVCTFDTSQSLFNADVVKGENLTWADIIVEPAVCPSPFDGSGNIPLEVTINDQSVFLAGTNRQTAFRRAGLLYKDDTNEIVDLGDVGVVTLHWSVMQDPSRPLDLSHEYLNVWKEASDFSGNQFSFQAGQMLDTSVTAPKDTFKIFGRENNLLFSTPIDPLKWQNFAVTLDYDQK